MYQKSFAIVSRNKINDFKKKIYVDSDKSISIRAFLFSAISENISIIKNPLLSEDVISTIKCLKKLGVKISREKGKFLVYGKGIGSLRAKKNLTLDFGNSGTLARLLIGILTSNPNIEVKIKGDKSLNKRSMQTLIKQMERFGAEFLPRNKFYFPLKIVSSEIPIGIKYTSGKSAQIKSAVILAALNSFGTTLIEEEHKSRDHTENILSKNQKCITIKKGKKNIIQVYGKRQLSPLNIDIPGDPSSAAFFISLCLLTKKSELVLRNIQLNPTRSGFLRIMKNHGAKISILNKKIKNNETIGDIQVKSSKLKKLRVGKNYYVNATDEYPIMFVVAALIEGTSSFKGIGELKNKESDRIKVMQRLLRQAGVKSIFKNDELKIFGKTKLRNTRKRKIEISNILDHRICMSAMILSQITGIKAKIKNFETVRTSSPNFLKILRSLGGKFEIK